MMVILQKKFHRLHLSLSTGFRFAPVCLHRTLSAAFGQMHSRCGQLISEMTACVLHDKAVGRIMTLQYYSCSEIQRIANPIQLSQ